MNYQFGASNSKSLWELEEMARKKKTELSFLGFILWIEPYEKTSCAKAESANKQLVLSKNF